MIRLLVLVAVVLGLGVIAWGKARQTYDRITAEAPTTWFAPYVDVTLTPTLHFEDPLASPSSNHVLGFVVADRTEPCSPTWGTYYDLDAAGRQLDLDRRIARLRERGGDAVIALGGAFNDELAVSCTDVSQLTDAYRAVVNRYAASTLDFDIEGAAIADVAANARRAKALATVQREAAAKGHPLLVWLTLPVAPQGLDPAALALVDGALRAGVTLAGVNVMTMDYGGGKASGDSMAAADEKALQATWAQVDRTYRDIGQPMTADRVWAHIGATPMIGQNDVQGEETSLGDARELVRFADQVKLGRLSMWSANRDEPCGPQDDSARVSNTCSGVAQKPFAFSLEFARLSARLPVRTPPAAEHPQAVSRDNPEMSPYPIWRTSKLYDRGEKVVWHGTVYQSKWRTEGDLPDAPVAHLWDTPWRNIGPVLRSDAASAPPSVKGRQPRWSADQVYLKGQRASFGGFVYEAKWWTQGDQPQPDPDRPLDAPWTLIGKAAPEDLSALGTAAYPRWMKTATYVPGSRVALGGHVYEATSWTHGFRPTPSPKTRRKTPWRVIADGAS